MLANHNCTRMWVLTLQMMRGARCPCAHVAAAIPEHVWMLHHLAVQVLEADSEEAEPVREVHSANFPRVFLVVQVLEDVSEEHARKTITVEKFPHMPMITAASIHPCKHAVTMKKLSSMMETDTHHITVDRWGLRMSANFREARPGPLHRCQQLRPA